MEKPRLHAWEEEGSERERESVARFGPQRVSSIRGGLQGQMDDWPGGSQTMILRDK
jgi:hypothetical protein